MSSNIKRTNFKHIPKQRSEYNFNCVVCKQIGLPGNTHGFKDCPSLLKLKEVQETEKRKAKEEKLVAIGNIVSEQIDDVLKNKLEKIENTNKEILKKIDESTNLLKKLKCQEMEIVQIDDEKLPPTVDEWCEEAIAEIKEIKRRSTSKVRKAFWDDKLAKEHDRWETLFHLARMLIEQNIGDKDSLNFNEDTTLNEAIDAICQALV